MNADEKMKTNLATELKAQWTTARGYARWARRNIGWHYGKLSNGEEYCVSGHWDNYQKRMYVALIVYGGGEIKTTKTDVVKLKTLFDLACSRKNKE